MIRTVHYDDQGRTLLNTFQVATNWDHLGGPEICILGAWFGDPEFDRLICPGHGVLDSVPKDIITRREFPGLIPGNWY